MHAQLRICIFLALSGFLPARIGHANALDPNELVESFLSAPERTCYEPEIVNGKPTKDFGPVVHVAFSKKEASGDLNPLPGCTGTITPDQVILLSAHCLCEKFDRLGRPRIQSGERIYVRINGVLLENPKIKIHPKYEPCSADRANYGPPDVDLAMIRVPRKDKAFKKIRALGSIPVDLRKPDEGVTVTAVGYGITVKKVSDYIDEKDFARMKKAGTNVIDQVGDDGMIVLRGPSETATKFNWSFRNLGYVPAPTGERVVTEHGDSGGPLLSAGKVIGVACAIDPGWWSTASAYTPLYTPANVAFVNSGKHWP